MATTCSRSASQGAAPLADLKRRRPRVNATPTRLYATLPNGLGHFCTRVLDRRRDVRASLLGLCHSHLSISAALTTADDQAGGARPQQHWALHALCLRALEGHLRNAWVPQAEARECHSHSMRCPGCGAPPLGINNAASRQKGGRSAAEPRWSRLGGRASLPAFCRRSAVIPPL